MKGDLTAGEGSGVMEASEAGSIVYGIAAGEDCSLTTSSLAMTIITAMTVVFAGSHFCRGLPRLRFVGFGEV
jgi:hypothetical protein